MKITDTAESTDTTIRDIMTPDPVGVYFDQTISETAKIMRDAQVGAVLVVSGESLSGVVTDRAVRNFVKITPSVISANAPNPWIVIKKRKIFRPT